VTYANTNSIDFTKHTPLINQKIKLVQTNYSQDEKWDKKNLSKIIQDNLKQIDLAIKNRYKVVVLPESVFPIFLNQFPQIINILKQKSNKIAIITGGLFLDKNNNHYNSTYFFYHNKMQIANKVYLVPFGETTNFLPKFLGKYINKIFFKDAKDYLVAKQPTYFTIDNQSYKNAICYEATVQEMYQDNPKNIIAISNNGWYYPSIMPIIQKNMIQFLARKYKVVVYHSTNKSKSEVIW